MQQPSTQNPNPSSNPLLWPGQQWPLNPFVPPPAIKAETEQPLVYFKNPHIVNKDPLFMSIFMTELNKDKRVQAALIGMGDFQANKHNCHEGCPNENGECDDCYSGDTEFEMTHAKVLGSVWKRAYEKWKAIQTADSSAEDDE